LLRHGEDENVTGDIHDDDTCHGRIKANRESLLLKRAVETSLTLKKFARSVNAR
jgi:hypothetical protein